MRDERPLGDELRRHARAAYVLAERARGEARARFLGLAEGYTRAADMLAKRLEGRADREALGDLGQYVRPKI